jgi:hypothetical protein
MAAPGIAAHVFFHGRKAEAGRAIVLEGGGAVDHRVEVPEMRDHPGQQVAHRGLVAQVGAEGRAVAREFGAFDAGAPCVLQRVAVMHGYLPAGTRQRQRDLATQPLGGAGDKHGTGGGAGIRGQSGRDGNNPEFNEHT